MQKELDEVNEQLNIRTDYESNEYMKLIERVSELSEKVYIVEEINYDAEIEKVLKGLGFERKDFTRQTSEFGWMAYADRAVQNFIKKTGSHFTG